MLRVSVAEYFGLCVTRSCTPKSHFHIMMFIYIFTCLIHHLIQIPYVSTSLIMCLVSETYTNCVCFKMCNFSYFQCKSRGHGFGSDYPSSWSMATYMHILFKGIQRMMVLVVTVFVFWNLNILALLLLYMT